MLEDLALWFMCNPLTQDLNLCLINSILVFPGLFGLFSVLIIYILVAIYLMCRLAVSLLTTLNRWRQGRRD